MQETFSSLQHIQNVQDKYDSVQKDKYIEILTEEYQKICVDYIAVNKKYNALLQDYKKLEASKQMRINYEIIEKVLMDSEKLAQEIIENAYEEESRIIAQTKKNVEYTYKTIERAVSEAHNFLSAHNAGALGTAEITKITETKPIKIKASESSEPSEIIELADIETDTERIKVSETAAKMIRIFEQPVHTVQTVQTEAKQHSEAFEQYEQYEKAGSSRQNKSNKSSKRKKGKKRRAFSIVSDVIFYLANFIILFAIITAGGKDGAPRTFMGYSYFTVLTSSMQDEIPKGSLILVKQTEESQLAVGDTITFMKDSTTSVTHKIINILENYENSGARGFQTKGVNNTNADQEIVYPVNIVGKVIFVMPVAGAVISALKSNIHVVLIMLGICIAILLLLRVIYRQLFTKDDLQKI